MDKKRKNKYSRAMIDDPKKILLSNFIKSYREVFDIKQLQKFLSMMGVNCSEKDCREFLANDPRVFSLKDDRYITRAGAFTDELFSIRPTAREIEKGVIPIGSRCIPFVDSNIISGAIDFYIEGQLIPKKSALFDSDFAIDLFQLYGEEYAPQYIAADLANAELQLEKKDFLLPAEVYLTGLDYEWLNRNFGFEKGDRILCCVKNWGEGVINAGIIHEHETLFTRNELREKRSKWYSDMEEILLESFEVHGPCTCIEDQVAKVFCENLSRLSVPACGSMEEFLNNHSKKIAYGHFGVETRLWRKGEEIPAIGPWNLGSNVGWPEEAGDLPMRPVRYETLPYVKDAFILDMFYSRKDNLEELVERYYPNGYEPSAKDKRVLLLHLKSRSATLGKTYNWFKDQQYGYVRKKALELFTRVNYMMLKVDRIRNDAVKLPQHELIILTQIFAHLSQLVEFLGTVPDSEESVSGIMDSLEGMRWNFDELEGSLKKALREWELSQFKVFKS